MRPTRVLERFVQTRQHVHGSLLYCNTSNRALLSHKLAVEKEKNQSPCCNKHFCSPPLMLRLAKKTPQFKPCTALFRLRAGTNYHNVVSFMLKIGKLSKVGWNLCRARPFVSHFSSTAGWWEAEADHSWHGVIGGVRTGPAMPKYASWISYWGVI